MEPLNVDTLGGTSEKVTFQRCFNNRYPFKSEVSLIEGLHYMYIAIQEWTLILILAVFLNFS